MQWLLLIFIIPYIYSLFRIYKNLKTIRQYQAVKSTDIFISVIVACRNEEKNLPELLDCLSKQDYNPDNFEIIIADDNSNDNTFSIASGFSKIKNLKVLRNKGTGKKKAIRAGIRTSSGKLIITTDGDCRMEAGWLKVIASFYSENRPDMIICPVRPEKKPGFFNRFQEIEFLSLQGVTAGTAAGGNPVMCNGANLAFTKEAYEREQTNLHDELVSGDDMFLLLALKNDPGNKILWLESPESVVTTKISDTMGSFLRQRTRWLSKAGAYKDNYTRLLGIVTFVTISLQWVLLIAGIFNPVFLPVFFASFLLKSFPDYLIVKDMALRYGIKKLPSIFIPSQLIYPVYIIIVFSCFLSGAKKYRSPLTD